MSTSTSSTRTTASSVSTSTVADPLYFCIEWNAENQLTRVTKNAVEQARFKYDPRGRRAEKVAGSVSTSWTYDEGNALREVRGATTLKYVGGLELDEPLGSDDGTALGYFHADGLGSIGKTTSQAGTVILSRRFDAWGNLELGGTTSGAAFTAREHDSETGLAYYRARYYDPKDGRFLGEDPVRGKGSLFPYVRNNPVARVDPMGLQDEAAQVTAAMTGLCRGIMTNGKCAFALIKNGLLPCFQKICYDGKCPQFHVSPGTTCAEAVDSRNVILHPNAFKPNCGEPPTGLQGTIAHELTHVCFFRGEGPQQPNGEKDCDIPKSTRDIFGRPYCSDASLDATNRRTSEVSKACSGQ